MRLKKVKLYSELMRLNKPIGIYLLLWPTLWALWLAGSGQPNPVIVAVFVAGVVLMRSAGCVINDFADRNVDGLVERTKLRPMARGAVNPKEALLLFCALALTAFLLVVLLTNTKTILASFVGLGLASIYPFMKRWTHLPQIVLGAAFAWAIPMAYWAIEHPLDMTTWILYALTVLWVVAYDTIYAMVDRSDDLNAGIKSTAILFGQWDTRVILFIQVLVILSWVVIAMWHNFGWVFYLSLFMGIGLMIHQACLIKRRNSQACFKAFLSSHWFGAVIWFGLVLHFSFF